MTFFLVWLSKRTLNTNYITNVQTQLKLQTQTQSKYKVDNNLHKQ